LLARLFGESRSFWIGHEWKWNLFDALLVLTSIADLIMSTFAQTMGTNFSAGPLWRLIRFFRLARLSRVIRLFAQLRLVLFMILDSMISLFWCFIVIGIVLYVFSIMFLNVAASHFGNASTDATDPVSQDLEKYFGSLYRSMLSLFMVITGGIDWYEVSNPLVSVHWLYGPVFFFYVFVMNFGVLNVVVGTFVTSAQEIASKDREALVKFELKQHEVQTRRIKAFFEEADIDKSGTLSWEEFESHLRNDKVKAYFSSMELDVSQAHDLFELLDADGSDQVTIDEFLEGCMRLKGVARSTELNMLVHMCKKVFKEMMGFMDWTEAKMGSMEAHMQPAK